MAYLQSQCNCDYTAPPSTINPVQCTACNGNKHIYDSESTQKKIGGPENAPKPYYADVNWNQMSDRAVPAQQTAYHPTRGNSTKCTVTSDRPGAGAPAGKGVDVKHGSYARYLGQKKAGNIRTQPLKTAVAPLQGNKTRVLGIITSSARCCA